MPEPLPNPPVDDALSQRMEALGVREADIDESFVRSGGHGGQNVNKVATCVMLVHRPTGVIVKCQETRHQAQNRSIARKLLVEKLESSRKAAADAERARREKMRRQKRGPQQGGEAENIGRQGSSVGEERRTQKANI